MDVAAALLDALRPRRSVYLVLGGFALLVGQYYLRVLADVSGPAPVVAVLDALLGALVRPAAWLASLVGDPATMGDAPQLALALPYGYLLAAALATLCEVVAAAL